MDRNPVKNTSQIPKKQIPLLIPNRNSPHKADSINIVIHNSQARLASLEDITFLFQSTITFLTDPINASLTQAEYENRLQYILKPGPELIGYKLLLKFNIPTLPNPEPQDITLIWKNSQTYLENLSDYHLLTQSAENFQKTITENFPTQNSYYQNYLDAVSTWANTNYPDFPDSYAYPDAPQEQHPGCISEIEKIAVKREKTKGFCCCIGGGSKGSYLDRE
jgi:hypothetical protein